MQALRHTTLCGPLPPQKAEKFWVRKYLFGYRVQVGNPDGGFGAEYCCGMNTYVIGLVSMMAQLALRSGRRAAELPRQVIKPMWNDQPCFQQLALMAGCTHEEIQAFYDAYPPDRHDARRL